ncbi:MAG: tripartite tricarboxylate transporter substrate binding protein [Pseudomonadota bacterium]
MKFSNVLRWAACALLPTFGALVAAQPAPYPNKPVRLIVAFAPGGSTDGLARIVAQKLSESLGQQVVVDNKPGGNTIIGSEALTKAPKDGYTLLLATVDHSVVPQLQTTPYDPVKDFAAIGGISYTQLLLVANPAFAANNVQELVALAKSRPGQLNVATAGSGGVQHLTGEMLATLTGTKLEHIPYRGGGPAIADVMGGQVQLYFAIPISAITHVNGGKLKAIAITGTARNEALPAVPTFAEAGVPGLDVKTWYGLFAPAGTPRPILDRLSAELNKVLATPDMKDRLRALGMDAMPMGPDEFGGFVKGEVAKWGQVIKAANVKIETKP